MPEEYSWDTPLKEIWEKASKNPPDVPHYQKLIALAQLKQAEALVRYTRWLVAATGALVACAVVQLVTTVWHK